MDYKQSANFEFTQTKKKKYILLELESEMDIFLMNLIIQITQYICKLYIIHKYNPVTFMLNMCPNTNMLLWVFFNFHILEHYFSYFMLFEWHERNNGDVACLIQMYHFPWTGIGAASEEMFFVNTVMSVITYSLSSSVV